MSGLTKQQLGEQKRQATRAKNQAKREAASFRARMADHFYGLSLPIPQSATPTSGREHAKAFGVRNPQSTEEVAT